jgi:uncharacterized protein involved in cysteine biosynthesis
MLNIILTLVFSIVMLVFMAFPAMKIAEWIETKITLTDTWHNILQIIITIFLSLLVGLFLRFA